MAREKKCPKKVATKKITFLRLPYNDLKYILSVRVAKIYIRNALYERVLETNIYCWFANKLVVDNDKDILKDFINKISPCLLPSEDCFVNKSNCPWYNVLDKRKYYFPSFYVYVYFSLPRSKSYPISSLIFIPSP